jgi:hypothetical protein
MLLNVDVDRINCMLEHLEYCIDNSIITLECAVNIVSNLVENDLAPSTPLDMLLCDWIDDMYLKG